MCSRFLEVSVQKKMDWLMFDNIVLVSDACQLVFIAGLPVRHGNHHISYGCSPVGHGSANTSNVESGFITLAIV